MKLSPDKSYRTVDGTVTGIRLEIGPYSAFDRDRCNRNLSPNCWVLDGIWNGNNGSWDLVEESASSFSYEACPIGPDGHRRAMTFEDVTPVPVEMLASLHPGGLVETLERWRQYGDKLDGYVTPAGSVGVRYGDKPEEYLSVNISWRRVLAARLRAHVNDRGGPTILNGAWEMMLEAADAINIESVQPFGLLADPRPRRSV